MITQDMIKIYKRFNGDIDGLARCGTAVEKEIITDSHWFLIDKLAQMAFLLQYHAQTAETVDSWKTEIIHSCKDEAVVDEIYRLRKRK